MAIHRGLWLRSLEGVGNLLEFSGISLVLFFGTVCRRTQESSSDYIFREIVCFINGCLQDLTQPVLKTLYKAFYNSNLYFLYIDMALLGGAILFIPEILKNMEFIFLTLIL